MNLERKGMTTLGIMNRLAHTHKKLLTGLLVSESTAVLYWAAMFNKISTIIEVKCNSITALHCHIQYKDEGITFSCHSQCYHSVQKDWSTSWLSHRKSDYTTLYLVSLVFLLTPEQWREKADVWPAPPGYFQQHKSANKY